MDKMLLIFSLLLCCAVVQGLVCNECIRTLSCDERNVRQCVAKKPHLWCYTAAEFKGNITYERFGCAYFRPCLSWEPILDEDSTFIVKCCNTDRCNGRHVIEANRPSQLQNTVV